MNCKSVDKFLEICYGNSRTHIDKIFYSCKLNVYACVPSIILQLKAPTIYKEIMKRIGFELDFNKMCYNIEIFSVIFSIIFSIVIIVVVCKYICKRILRKKNIFIDK